MEKWNVLNSSYVYKNPPFGNLRKDHCRLPNGKAIDGYYVSELPMWVNAVVLTHDMLLVLVKQYRHGAGEICIEIPAGRVEEAEDPADAIVREVAEETGYISQKRPILLGDFFPNPATADNRICTYLFVDAHRELATDFDETEDIEVMLVPFHSFGDMIFNGGIRQLYSVAAYLLARDFMERERLS